VYANYCVDLSTLLHTLGEKNDWDAVAVGVEVRDVPASRQTEVSSYGTIDGGFKLTRLAWPKMEHRFAVRRNKEQVDGSLGTPPARVIFGHHRFPAPECDPGGHAGGGTRTLYKAHVQLLA
jgi:hypothetical protein